MSNYIEMPLDTELKVRWNCGYTGIPLELHWLLLSAQCTSSGNPVLICIIGTHWKYTGEGYTGMPLDRPHWNYTGTTLAIVIYPVYFQWQSSVNLHNWNALEVHWRGVHWDATGQTALELHWNYTGNCYLPSVLPVAIQC